jgi:hypothetical protein
MRKSPSNSMQKTYDECYLICSTAIYFEGQVCSACNLDARCVSIEVTMLMYFSCKEQ